MVAFEVQGVGFVLSLRNFNYHYNNDTCVMNEPQNQTQEDLLVWILSGGAEQYSVCF